MSMFMKIQYVNGDVTAKKYENWVEIESLHFPKDRKMQDKMGQMQNRVNSIPKLYHATIVKKMDSVSNILFQHLISGKSIGQIDIHLCKTADNLEPYAKFVLEDVMVARHDEQMIQGIRPTEVVDLSFRKIQRTVIKHDKSNKPVTQNTTGYDHGTGQLS